MTAVNVRKQGGAAIMTIPASLLNKLHIEIGSTLELSVDAGVLTARPTEQKKRYSLDELLAGVTPARLAKLNADTAAAREGEPVGRELI